MLVTKIKDPVSSLTHLVGAILSLVGMIVLVSYAMEATVWHVVTFSIFGSSLVLLYTASTVYHSVNKEGLRKILRKIDHMMIFVLIAGTYTPICLIPLRGPWGWSLFGSVWGISLLGIFLKILCGNIPRWLSTLIYTVTGWLVIIAIYPAIKSMPLSALLWLVAGGVVYTIGALIYGFKWPNPSSKFGFHEIFHLFVMGGSFCHFWLMYKYILYL